MKIINLIMKDNNNKITNKNKNKNNHQIMMIIQFYKINSK